MNKEQFISLLSAQFYTAKDLDQLARLQRDYPYFSLPRFLDLKIRKNLSEDLEQNAIERAAAYSSDRKFLYKWLQGDVEKKEISALHSSEIEFLDEEIDELDSSSSFELIDDFSSEVEMSVAPAKDETEMEDPEVDEPLAVPVIEPLDDKRFLDEETVQMTEAEGVIIDEELEDDLKEVADVEGIDAPEIEGAKELIYAAVDIDKLLKEKMAQAKEKEEEGSINLIEQFLQKEPGGIRADTQTSLEGDVSVGSVKEDDRFITDTLAKIYVKQGLHAKAIYAYERLSLKYPEKSAYFAAQIEKIKNISNL